jgi:hypothetical protein
MASGARAYRAPPAGGHTLSLAIRAALGRKPRSRPARPRLPSSGTVPPFTDADHRAETVPDDGDVLPLDFDSLRTREAQDLVARLRAPAHAPVVLVE